MLGLLGEHLAAMPLGHLLGTMAHDEILEVGHRTGVSESECIKSHSLPASLARALTLVNPLCPPIMGDM